jgi:transcriptional/translational regulatory protein YebC/TACO1
MELALEAGADDVKQEGSSFEIVCDPDLYTDVEDALEKAEIEVEVKQVTRIPENTVDLEANEARKVLKLLELLDDHDDVQNVSTNLNIPEEALAELGDG